MKTSGGKISALPTKRGKSGPSQPQQERSAETRQRLIEATIECFAKYGFSDTTTSLIAKTAGVTRGAYLHHFGSREQLLTEAFGHLLNNVMGELEKRIIVLFQENRQSEILDEIWKAGFEDWLYPGFELLLHCRHDPEMRRYWMAHSAKFLVWRRRIFSNLTDGEVQEDSDMMHLADGFLDLLRGMALMDVVRTKATTRAQLDFWRGVFEREVAHILSNSQNSKTNKSDNVEK
ncbi:TetR/AcrR family transcriptional regulator [Hyphococcus flavus]|uniref:TetR/AcrR family transcriptional regulator n=1 Tax=Hyphococcus flavus TaxID=1866326 RepID=A0AAE9ZH80_9PROT|nr:TetR/AcrR family transcriptional regulator [Hyphococcus flavus]WDI30135.1 TetR/AcrR family transcriptional regulator [Hyphococcus flavus]